MHGARVALRVLWPGRADETETAQQFRSAAGSLRHLARRVERSSRRMRRMLVAGSEIRSGIPVSPVRIGRRRAWCLDVRRPPCGVINARGHRYGSDGRVKRRVGSGRFLMTCVVPIMTRISHVQRYFSRTDELAERSRIFQRVG